MYPLTFQPLVAMVQSTKFQAKDVAFIVTILVHLTAIVWWGSKITSSVDNLATVTAQLQEGYVDLKVRMAVQEALSGIRRIP